MSDHQISEINQQLKQGSRIGALVGHFITYDDILAGFSDTGSLQVYALLGGKKE